jgi:endonuclease/exonuclease/phosphatase family metal-dependent hydrolase
MNTRSWTRTLALLVSISTGGCVGDATDEFLDGQETVDGVSNEVIQTNLTKDSSTVLRFASYNVLNDSIFNNTRRKENFSRILKATNADIWAFQEVSYGSDTNPSEGDKWLQNLKDMTGKQNWSYSWDQEGRYLLSSYPIKWNKKLGNRVHATLIDLPSTVSATDLVVVNVHFAPGGADRDDTRCDQAISVANFVNTVKSGKYAVPGGFIPSNVTIVTAGDFNAQPGSRPFKIINSLNPKFKDVNYNPSYTEQLSNLGPSHLFKSSEKKTHGSVKFTNGVGAMTGAATYDHMMWSSSNLQANNSCIINTFFIPPTALNKFALKQGDVAKDPNGNAIGPNDTIAVDHLPMLVDFSKK